MNLTNRECDFIASFDVLADAVVEVVEGGLGMLEAAGDEVFAYDDAAVFAMIGSVAGLEHGADARELGVDANVGLAMAGGAVSSEPCYYRHLAGILAARDDGYGIGAGGQGGMHILGTVADADAVDGKMTVDGRGILAITGDVDIHIDEY